MNLFFKSLFIIISINSYQNLCPSFCNWPSSIFVPHQLSYNPILENALTYNAQYNQNFDYIFSAKPIYMQTVGSKFNKYFIINHASSLSIEENNCGDINPLWFKVISSDDTFYSSTLSFQPKAQIFGSMLYFAVQLPHHLKISINTALITAHNNINLCEQNITEEGTLFGYRTISQSFANIYRLFGRICGIQRKTGFDDIQVKLIYEPYESKNIFLNIYTLLGIPTGKGSQAKFLFEPLVGSNHAQLGVGTNLHSILKDTESFQCFFNGEAKYRYAFTAEEYRSFDLTDNGQWSRYMLFVNRYNNYVTYPAINDLTFKAKISPQHSFDLYLATNFAYKHCNFEIGYDFWYRSSEEISICTPNFENTGMADLKGIAFENPTSASTANISEGVQPTDNCNNQMTSDASFTPITKSDINLLSGAQASLFSNSVYASIGQTFDAKNYTMQIGINVSFEHTSRDYTPDTIMTWLNIDFYF